MSDSSDPSDLLLDWRVPLYCSGCESAIYRLPYCHWIHMYMHHRTLNRSSSCSRRATLIQSIDITPRAVFQLSPSWIFPEFGMFFRAKLLSITHIFVSTEGTCTLSATTWPPNMDQWGRAFIKGCAEFCECVWKVLDMVGYGGPTEKSNSVLCCCPVNYPFYQSQRSERWIVLFVRGHVSCTEQEYNSLIALGLELL